MAKAGTLIVDLIAETQQFRADMQKAADAAAQHGASISRSASEISGAFDLATKVAGAFGIALGAREILDFAANVIKTTAEIKTMAQQVGITTGELQAMRFEALQLGVSQDQADTAMAHLTRTIGEASDGGRAAIDVFNKLGVGILDANNQIRPTFEIFRDVAQALSQIPDPAARARAEVQLFGRAGQQLDPFMRQGAAGIDAAKTAAENLVGVLDDETINRLDRINNELATMALRFKNIAAEAIAATEPLINFFANGGGHLAPGTVRPVPGETAAQALARGQAQLGIGGSGLPGAGTFGREDLGDLNPASVSVGAPGAHNPAASDALDRQQKVIDNLRFQAEQLARSSQAQEVYNNLQQAGVGINTAAGQSIVQLTQRIQAERAEIDEIKKAGQDWDKEVAEAKAIHDSVRTSQEKLNDATQRATELMKDGLLTQQDVNRVASDYNHLLQQAAQLHQSLQTDQERANQELKLANDLYQRGLISLEDYNRELKKIKGETSDFADGINGLTDAFSAAITGADTWANALTKAIEIVAAELEKLLGVGKNGSSAGSEIESLFTTGASFLFGGGSSLNPGVGPGGLGFLTFGGPRAAGGDVGPGMFYQVNERGREYFAPKVAGTILPADFMDQARPANDRGGDVHVHMSVYPKDYDSFRKSSGQALHDGLRQAGRAYKRNGG